MLQGVTGAIKKKRVFNKSCFFSFQLINYFTNCNELLNLFESRDGVVLERECVCDLKKPWEALNG